MVREKISPGFRDSRPLLSLSREEMDAVFDRLLAEYAPGESWPEEA